MLLHAIAAPWREQGAEVTAAIATGDDNRNEARSIASRAALMSAIGQALQAV
ncbi:hypothetical protein [Xanthomonas graminis]|uniref:hypothetical protein n=1 Tax=Xanthomonas graminis TaxID=3390026 RepID=UPI001F2F9636|nr:hypothetical protein [Xanthomonas translucens]UKE74897.1 hypothetical protein KFS85_08450 [Xanthomonas translucens pv. phleipratensis]